MSDATRFLRGNGPRAYLDAECIVAMAREEGCDAIHPGYGFLSENAAFARRCLEAGVLFVGPRPETLDLFGDKTKARMLAERCGVPVPAGTSWPTSLDEARAFLRALGPGGTIMVKAAAAACGCWRAGCARCRLRALSLRGAAGLRQRRSLCRGGAGAPARHVEVQVAGDGSGAVSDLWERECSIQRQRQKLVEIAPAPGLSPAMSRP